MSANNHFVPEHVLRLFATKMKSAEYVVPINSAMTDYAINTKPRQAAFLAQIFHESGNLSCVEENLNYSAEGLMRTWPTRFPSLSFATHYARQPEKIANNVYANRMGNRDEASGDGWKYRGSGLIQLTGKNNQLLYALEAGVDVLNVSGYLRTTEGACASAGWFWASCNASAMADRGDFDGVSDLINIGRKTKGVGDAIGYKHRLQLYEAFKKALSV